MNIFKKKLKSKKTHINSSRESNFELMRIISVLFIILWHFLLRLSSSVHGVSYVINTILMAILIVHVNSFVLVTGYFQCKKDFKLTKLISLNNATWFYTVVINFSLLFLGMVSFKTSDIVKIILPINFLDQQNYWFITIYMLLYLISPLLNTIIKFSSKERLQKIILVLIFAFMVLPSLTGNGLFYDNKGGYSLVQFIILYFIGAYFRNFPIKDSYFFKVFSKNSRKLIYLSVFSLCVIFEVMNFFIGEQLMESKSLFSSLGSLMKANFFAYSNPVVVLQTICFVLWFSEINIKNKIIDKIAGCSLGVYLIHNNYCLINLVILPYLNNIKSFGGYNFLIVLGYMFLVFFICVILELLRQIVFKFIYNRKLSSWFRKKYKTYFTSLGIEIK